MASRTVTKLDRVPRRPIDKFAGRRAELAEAALQTLSELGYARTSLREIAQNSAFTHGVLHYYFADKVDLILCSVRQYKARCVTRYDEVTAAARSRDELVDGFIHALGQTVREDGHLHRLWYDIRAEAMYETAFQSDIAEIDQSLEDMIWRIMTRLAELSGARRRFRLRRPTPSWTGSSSAACSGICPETMAQSPPCRPTFAACSRTSGRLDASRNRAPLRPAIAEERTGPRT